MAYAVVLVTPLFMGSAILPASFDQRILAAHNRERVDLGLDPLSWNPALAQSARQWADYLASTGRFEHAPENHDAPEGENIWAGTKGYFAPEAMVGAWIREKRFFQPGVFPNNSTTGKVEDVGHYTQLIWHSTTEVGCAEASSADEDILVCRYGEAGNYKGERPIEARIGQDLTQSAGPQDPPPALSLPVRADQSGLLNSTAEIQPSKSDRNTQASP